MKKLLGLICMMIVLGLSSSGFALSPILMGDFEAPGTPDGTNFRWDSWMVPEGTAAVTTPVQTATRGTHSLKWKDAVGNSWKGSDISYPYGGTMNDQLTAWMNPGSDIAVDVTALPAEVPGGWMTMTIFYSAAAGWGFDDTLWQNVPIDGMPHTLVFHVTENIRTIIRDSMGGWGCNLGFTIRSASGTESYLYVDNIWIYPDGYSANGPYGPGVSQTYNLPNVNVTLSWKAGPDPNGVYPVNPDIVNEYVFMTNGTGTDPNLYYVGATNEDPGTTDPNSQYGPFSRPTDKVLSWTIVEAIDGFAQSFTAGVSTLNDVDPNNIIGPKWTFETLKSSPVITTQPVSTRLKVADTSAQFTVGLLNTVGVSYQWYFSPNNNQIDPADTAIAIGAGGNTNTVTLTSHNKAYQAYYYCKIWNAFTVSGGGTSPDVYSNVVSLVVERKVAEYLFDGNLTDTSGMAFNGTGVGTPTYVTGVGGSGSALSLNGTSQYVEIGNSADPNTFNKAFPRADLFTNFTGGAGTEIGSGGGLDVGSIMCWIKLNATVANQVSPIMFNSNAGWPHTEFFFGVGTDSTAANTVSREYIWNNSGNLSFWMDPKPIWADPFNMGGDGQWHMLAATWNTGNAKCYLDGNLLASWSTSTGEFSAWDNTMTIGFDGTNYFGGAIDNLRVYNYELTAEAIENEAYLVTGKHGCLYDFVGSNHNSNQLGTSYCKVDLADFADFAAIWLNEGFYPPAP